MEKHDLTEKKNRFDVRRPSVLVLVLTLNYSSSVKMKGLLSPLVSTVFVMRYICQFSVKISSKASRGWGMVVMWEEPMERHL